MDFEDVVVPLDPVTRPDDALELVIEVDDALGARGRSDWTTDTRPLGIAVTLHPGGMTTATIRPFVSSFSTTTAPAGSNAALSVCWKPAIPIFA